ncbi:hypothetical protein BTO06_00245 [Tenacibaculum sp. SZ-18]|nr:hypothetical protein BTO06_00245 [Tenacibaculum sp. SZ-18]
MVIKTLIIGSFFLTLLGSTFIHEKFQPLKKWEPYKTHYKEYNKIIKGTNNKRSELLSKLENGELDVPNFIIASKKLELNKKSLLDDYHSKKKQLKGEYSVLGYSSFRIFAYEFGRSYLTLGLSLILLVLVLVPGIISEFKNVLIIGSIGFIFVSTFWLYFALFIKTNYNIVAYEYGLLIASALTTLIVIGLFYIYKFVELKKKETRKDLQEMIDSGKELVDLLKTT